VSLRDDAAVAHGGRLTAFDRPMPLASLRRAAARQLRLLQDRPAT
jgi:hypothetical protein